MEAALICAGNLQLVHCVPVILVTGSTRIGNLVMTSMNVQLPVIAATSVKTLKAATSVPALMATR